MMRAESRDFRVATYSVVSLIGTDWATWILTGIAGSACGGAPFTESPLQAAPSAARSRVPRREVLGATGGVKPTGRFELKACFIVCCIVPAAYF
jgi:hypothetical protein